MASTIEKNRFIVGGAVRDQLLGLRPKDRDWVVVGHTVEDMLAAGYKQVGADFPVFLHPETGEEHALARTERKSAPGHRGFTVHASPEVTLEEDLARRDLTINAIAMSADGDLVDPHGGQQDLKAGLLRHVSPAFAEDPLRVLRVARFAARYPGFLVDPDTADLMQGMVTAGDLDDLTPERVWGEMEKAMAAPAPHRFVEVLRHCGALQAILPEVDVLFGVPQPPEHHPEIDTGVHVLMTLERAAALTGDPQVRFAALMHDLGKGVTDPAAWPAHHGHEEAGGPLVDQVCDRLRVPNNYRRLAKAVSVEHLRVHRAADLRPGKLLRVIESLGGLKDRGRLEQALIACQADAQGRTGRESSPYPQRTLVMAARDAAAAVSSKPLIERGIAPGPHFGDKLRQERISAIKRATWLSDREAESGPCR